MMSLEALINAGARLMGGVLVRWISAKTLLLFALAIDDHGPVGAERWPMAPT